MKYGNIPNILMFYGSWTPPETPVWAPLGLTLIESTVLWLKSSICSIQVWLKVALAIQRQYNQTAVYLVLGHCKFSTLTKCHHAVSGYTVGTSL